MSMPTKAIDRLFQRLGATYGRQWTSMWEHTPIADVKTAWAHELSIFADRLEVIAWALENLPARAPNAIEFKNLCRQAPRPETQLPKLPEPVADPERLKSEFAKLREVMKPEPGARRDGRSWARRILQRHEDGEIISTCTLRFAKEALRMNAPKIMGGIE